MVITVPDRMQQAGSFAETLQAVGEHAFAEVLAAPGAHCIVSTSVGSAMLHTRLSSRLSRFGVSLDIPAANG